MGRSGGGGHVSGGGFSGGHVSGGGSHHGPRSPLGSGRSGMPRGGMPGGSPFGGAPFGGGSYRRRPYGGLPSMMGPMIFGSAMGRRFGQRPIRPNSGVPNGPDGPASVDNGGGCVGLGCGILLLVAVALLVLGSFSMCSGSIATDSGYGSDAATTAGETPISTEKREPLSLSLAVQTPFYEDADGDWIDDSAAMERGLREFWQKTGVYPFVYIAPNGAYTTATQCSEKARQLYSTLTDDEAHLVLVFCDDNKGGFVYGYDIGSSAATVMDSEAISILAHYLGRYYDTEPTEEGVFSRAFASSADRIMSVTQPWYVVGAPLIIVVVIAGVVLVIVVIKRQRDREREAYLREILNQPLEKFSDQKLRDLEEKYANSSTRSTSETSAKDTRASQDLRSKP